MTAAARLLVTAEQDLVRFGFLRMPHQRPPVALRHRVAIFDDHGKISVRAATTTGHHLLGRTTVLMMRRAPRRAAAAAAAA